MEHPARLDKPVVRSISEFAVGQSRKLKFTVDTKLIEQFAQFSGDRNPLHMDAAAARNMGHPRQVAHGVITVAFLSRLIGMEIPGPGALWMGQSIEWLAPVYPGDEIELEVTVAQISAAAGALRLGVRATNQRGVTVMSGESKVTLSEMGQQPVASNVSERVALVLGGSRGIGAAIAHRLAEMGIHVAINSRAPSSAADTLRGELKNKGVRTGLFHADIGEPGEAKDMFRKVLDEFGRADIVVHCATPELPNIDAESLRYADVEKYMRPYMIGALEAAAVIPGMKERRFGRFIFLGTSALFGQPPSGMAAYVIAKNALWGLTRSLATELGPFGITANMISPGMTATELTNHMSSRIKEVEARKSPARRLAFSEDTAAAVAFLVGRGGDYVNGINLPLMGGPN